MLPDTPCALQDFWGAFTKPPPTLLSGIRLSSRSRFTLAALPPLLF